MGLITGCHPVSKPNDQEEVHISIKRFDQDLFRISVYDIDDSIPVLLKKYPRFLPLFGYGIIEIGLPEQPGFNDGLVAFVTDFTIYRVSKRVQEVFPDIRWLEEILSKGFNKYKVYFPNRQIPEIITCISGFNQSVITADSMIVISLDKYLGSGDMFYKLLHPPVPEYQRFTMIPGKIPSDALYGWLLSEFPFNPEKDNLLSQMIYKGRAMYCVKQLLPEINDTLLWGYTASQLQFCLDNEKSMWEFMVENKLLFETEKFRVNQLVNPAPFTKDFSQQSPGRTAVWIGYRIAESLAKHHTGITLQELMEESDYQKMLQLSKYNP